MALPLLAVNDCTMNDDSYFVSDLTVNESIFLFNTPNTDFYYGTSLPKPDYTWGQNEMKKDFVSKSYINILLRWSTMKRVKT